MKEIPESSYFPEVIAQKVLGQDFWFLARFFLDIFQWCRDMERKGDFPLVVFITRRCHVLSAIFSDIFHHYLQLQEDGSAVPDYLAEVNLAELEQLEEKYFTTDTNLDALGRQVALYYLETDNLPRVLVADEMLLHGRALNHTLLQFERNVLRYYQEGLGCQNSFELSKLRERLIASLELRVFIQNDEPLLLISRYQRRLQPARICSPKEVRHYSQQFSLLVSISKFNNISYSWGLCAPAAPLKEELDLWKLFECEHAFFEKIATEQSDIEQHTYLWLYPDCAHPQAALTLRGKYTNLAPTMKDNFILAVPFIVFGDVPAENLLQLHYRIIQDFQLGPTFCLTALDAVSYGETSLSPADWDQAYLRWLSETNDLVLCALLCHRFFRDGREQNTQKFDWDTWLDIDTLSRNYLCIPDFQMSRTQRRARAKQTRRELRQLWDMAWEQADAEPFLLEEYLSIVLAGVPPIWEETFAPTESRYYEDIKQEPLRRKQLAHILDLTIAQIGYDAEYQAYEKYGDSLIMDDFSLSTWSSKKHSMGSVIGLDVVDRLSQKFPNDPLNLADVYYLVGLLIQKMDLGVIGMNPDSREGEEAQEGSETMFTALRAGEQALFIKPFLYQDYIPVLAELENRSGKQWKYLKEDILQLVMQLGVPSPDDLAEELLDFVLDLASVHQRLEDWDLLLFDNVDKWDLKNRQLKNPFYKRAFPHMLAQSQHMQTYYRL